MRKLTLIVTIALAALAAATAAVAGNVTATASITGGGSLALSHGSAATVSSTLDGTDQNATYTLPLSLSDIRGTGAGWNVTVTSTLFSDGSGHAFPAGTSSVTGVTSACVSGGSCTSATNSVTYPLTVPAASTAPAAVKLFNAAAGTGMGRFTLTPTFAVAIPGNAYAGSYASTVTLAAVSGP